MQRSNDVVIDYQKLNEELFEADYSKAWYKKIPEKHVLLYRNILTKKAKVHGDGLLARIPFLKGIHVFALKFLYESRLVDVSERRLNLPPMFFRNSENYDCGIDFSIYIQVKDAYKACHENKDAFILIQDMLQNALKPIFAGMTFDEINTCDINTVINDSVYDEIEDKYGIKITRTLKQRVFQTEEMRKKQEDIRKADIEYEATKKQVKKTKLIQNNDNKLAAQRTKLVGDAERKVIADYANELRGLGFNEEQVTKMIVARYYGSGSTVNVHNTREDDGIDYDYVPRRR